MSVPMSADDLFRLALDEMRGAAGDLYARLAPESYPLGREDADPNGAATILLARLLVPARDPDEVAIYRMPDGRAVLVRAYRGMLRAVELAPGGDEVAMRDRGDGPPLRVVNGGAGNTEPQDEDGPLLDEDTARRILEALRKEDERRTDELDAETDTHEPRH